MYENAIIASMVSLLIAIFSLRDAYRRRSRVDLAFFLFGILSAIRFANLFVWLNLDNVSPIMTPLRFLDFVLIVPIMIVGLEMFRANIFARSRQVNPRIVQLTYLLPVIIAPSIAFLFLYFPINTVRQIGVAVMMPLFLVILVYYLILMRNNPLRISKPEIIRGSKLFIAGYICLVIGEGVGAGILNLPEVAILVSTLGVLLALLGGLVQSTITSSIPYTNLGLDVIIVDDRFEIEMTTLLDDSETKDYHPSKTEKATGIVSQFYDDIRMVLVTGQELIKPYELVSVLKPNRVFQVELIPHNADMAGKAMSVMLVLRDITESIEHVTSGRLVELLDTIVDERNKAEYYLDLLGHDISNVLQGILLGTELMVKRCSGTKDKALLGITMDEVTHAIELIRTVRLMAEASTSEQKSVGMDVESIVKQSFHIMDSSLPEIQVQMNLAPFAKPFTITTEPLLEYGLAKLMRQCVLTQKDEFFISVNVQETLSNRVNVIIGTYHGSIAQQDMKRGFDMEMKRKLPGIGVGLSFVGELIGRYGGRLSHREVSLNEGETGVEFILEFPLP